MTISISVSPAAEARLRERAAAAGQPVPEFVSRLVEQAAAAASLEEVLAPIRREFAESGMSEDELTQVLEDAKHEMRRERRAGGRS